MKKERKAFIKNFDKTFTKSTLQGLAYSFLVPAVLYLGSTALIDLNTDRAINQTPIVATEQAQADFSKYSPVLENTVKEVQGEDIEIESLNESLIKNYTQSDEFKQSVEEENARIKNSSERYKKVIKYSAAFTTALLSNITLIDYLYKKREYNEIINNDNNPNTNNDMENN